MPNDFGMVLDTGQAGQVGFVGNEGDASTFGCLHVNLSVTNEESRPV